MEPAQNPDNQQKYSDREPSISTTRSQALRLTLDEVILPWAKQVRSIDGEAHFLTSGSLFRDRELNQYSDLDVIVLSDVLKDPHFYLAALEQLGALAESFQSNSGYVPVFFTRADTASSFIKLFQYAYPENTVVPIHLLYYSNLGEMLTLERSDIARAERLLNAASPLLPLDTPPLTPLYMDKREFFERAQLYQSELAREYPKSLEELRIEFQNAAMERINTGSDLGRYEMLYEFERSAAALWLNEPRLQQQRQKSELITELARILRNVDRSRDVGQLLGSYCGGTQLSSHYSSKFDEFLFGTGALAKEFREFHTEIMGKLFHNLSSVPPQYKSLEDIHLSSSAGRHRQVKEELSRLGYQEVAKHVSPITEPDSLDAIRQAIIHSDPHQVKKLARVSTLDAVEVVVDLLKHRDPSVQRRACEFSGYFSPKDGRIADALLYVAEASNDFGVVKWALRALGTGYTIKNMSRIVEKSSEMNVFREVALAIAGCSNESECREKYLLTLADKLLKSYSSKSEGFLQSTEYSTGSWASNGMADSILDYDPKVRAVIAALTRLEHPTQVAFDKLVDLSRIYTGDLNLIKFSLSLLSESGHAEYAQFFIPLFSPIIDELSRRIYHVEMIALINLSFAPRPLPTGFRIHKSLSELEFWFVSNGRTFKDECFKLDLPEESNLNDYMRYVLKEVVHFFKYVSSSGVESCEPILATLQEDTKAYEPSSFFALKLPPMGGDCDLYSRVSIPFALAVMSLEGLGADVANKVVNLALESQDSASLCLAAILATVHPVETRKKQQLLEDLTLSQAWPELVYWARSNSWSDYQDQYENAVKMWNSGDTAQQVKAIRVLALCPDAKGRLDYMKAAAESESVEVARAGMHCLTQFCEWSLEPWKYFYNSPHVIVQHETLELADRRTTVDFGLESSNQEIRWSTAVKLVRSFEIDKDDALSLLIDNRDTNPEGFRELLEDERILLAVERHILNTPNDFDQRLTLRRIELLKELGNHEELEFDRIKLRNLRQHKAWKVRRAAKSLLRKL